MSVNYAQCVPWKETKDKEEQGDVAIRNSNIREWKDDSVKNPFLSWVWWHTPLILPLGRKKLVDLCEFEASLILCSEFQDSHGYVKRSCLQKGGLLAEGLSSVSSTHMTGYSLL